MEDVRFCGASRERDLLVRKALHAWRVWKVGVEYHLHGRVVLNISSDIQRQLEWAFSTIVMDQQKNCLLLILTRWRTSAVESRAKQKVERMESDLARLHRQR